MAKYIGIFGIQPFHTHTPHNEYVIELLRSLLNDDVRFVTTWENDGDILHFGHTDHREMREILDRADCFIVDLSRHSEQTVSDLIRVAATGTRVAVFPVEDDERALAALLIKFFNWTNVRVFFEANPARDWLLENVQA